MPHKFCKLFVIKNVIITSIRISIKRARVLSHDILSFSPESLLEKCVTDTTGPVRFWQVRGALWRTGLGRVEAWSDPTKLGQSLRIFDADSVD